MISWGLITSCFIFTRGMWSFYGLRFLLGIAEAGFFPGVILYLSYWVPQKNLARAAALFLTSTAIAGVIGNPLGGAILYFTDASPLGLHNWQWLFLSEGIPSILVGLITLFYLTDRPQDARWLSPDERRPSPTSCPANAPNIPPMTKPPSATPSNPPTPGSSP